MMRKVSLFVLTVVYCICASFVLSAAAEQGNTTWQVITHIDEVLKEHPLPADSKSQMIKIAEDDTISAYIVRMMPGAELGPHYHVAHDEIEYVINGTGELFVNGKWVEFKAGSIHFNPARNVHAARNTGKEPLVVLIAFTPAMRETDRHFVK